MIEDGYNGFKIIDDPNDLVKLKVLLIDKSLKNFSEEDAFRLFNEKSDRAFKK